jgi:hypothetical protein
MYELVPEFKDMSEKLVSDLIIYSVITPPLDEEYRDILVASLSGWLKHHFQQYLGICCCECECNEDSEGDHIRPSWMEDRDSR